MKRKVNVQFQEVMLETRETILAIMRERERKRLMKNNFVILEFLNFINEFIF